MKLLDYQRDFYRNARREAGRNAYVFGNHKDAETAYRLAEILKRHQIELHEIAEEFTANGKTYKPGSGYIIPKNQKHHRLLEAMFERRTEFQDSLFYDISAWSFPLAFNLDFSDNAAMRNAGAAIGDLERPEVAAPARSEYALSLIHI